jgi:hypothetical protein
MKTNLFSENQIFAPIFALKKQYQTVLKTLFTVFLMMWSMGVFGQIAAWQLNGATGDEVTKAASTLDANLNNSLLTRGSGLTASSLTNAYGTTDFVASIGTKANAISGNKFIYFTLNAKAGYKVSLTTLDVRFRRSVTGPNTFRWQYSVDGTNFTDLGSADISYTGTTTGGNTQTQITLSGISDLQNVTNATTITIRLLGWGASAASGTFAIGRSLTTGATDYSLAVGGTVVAATCTTPTTSFASATVTKNVGDPNFTNAFTTNSAGAVTYTSSNTAAATINSSSGLVTVGSSTGTTTITASQAANATYCAATTTYTLTVNPSVVTNITGGGGVNIVGKFQNPSPPAYQQPINCDTNDKRVLQYRKVSTTTSNPSDGRGQWATTLNALTSPSTTLSAGEVYAGNYDPNPLGDGFLFTTGGGCGNPGNYNNKWVFGGNGQCAIDGVSIADYVTGGGTNMGINASTVGFYTFVLKDNTGSTNGYYVGYTTNAPIAISSTSQSMLCPTTATITATLSGIPSSQEKFYLRYNTTNDFSGATATSQVLGTVSGTTVTFNVPSLTAATTYNYYILTLLTD